MRKYKDEERLLNPEFETGCYDCGLKYGSPSWIEAIVPNEVWEIISPSYHKGAGLLCISCIARRCVEAGLKYVPVLMCGTEPLIAVRYEAELVWEQLENETS